MSAGSRHGQPTLRNWHLGDPRLAVLAVLGAIVMIGGGRKWLQGQRARRAIAGLSEPDVTPEAIRSVVEHGREGVLELFRLMETAPSLDQRHAAGKALATLWQHDQLIAEEEKAVIVRGYEVTWSGRRRYPRGLKAPMRIAVRFGVPFLGEPDGVGVTDANLEWSYRITGSDRPSLETFSSWTHEPGVITFALSPDNFSTLGPHRLMLQARVRTLGLTDVWQVALPHTAFSFDFDPALRVDSVLSTSDTSRGEAMNRAILLKLSETSGEAQYLDLAPGFTLRNPPLVRVNGPLPGDLAHEVWIEIEGVPSRYRAGEVVISAQSLVDGPVRRSIALGPIRDVDPASIDQPGERRIRVNLEPNAHLGWADPEIRSVWPDAWTSEWQAVRIIRQ